MTPFKHGIVKIVNLQGNGKDSGISCPVAVLVSVRWHGHFSSGKRSIAYVSQRKAGCDCRIPTILTDSGQLSHSHMNRPFALGAEWE
ncbi:hypothetical protein NPIL_206461 [Nephila pilipes]|uniref:Uncharacterized protein n=1 Tax=Nephila pilipes TaxID=299642 RepID=A0A8X6QFW5_NEPPI|nr:hypothetical protein NPIL_206461 [Nephila pilipes]